MRGIDQPLSADPEEWHRAFALRYHAHLYIAPLGNARCVVFSRKEWEPLFLGNFADLEIFINSYVPPTAPAPKQFAIDDLLDGLI
tara:strand:+ start:264 stop:518 length:255 start_codon:yes stop_codon:yes gene_type:complete